MTFKEFYKEIIVAGFGGQGVMLVGKLIAQAAMLNAYNVTYMPSYGAEVRGGTANCMLMISDNPIASPVVSTPDAVIAMNKASVNKFVKRIKPEGLLVMNSSLVDTVPARDDIKILAIPADDIAIELGAPKATNMVALGAYLQTSGFLDYNIAIKCLPKVLAKRYHSTLDVNSRAIAKGAEFAQKMQKNKVLS